ncbi:MAG: hypothetical protein K5945_02760 [Bacteroidaceae bacterium]|nr:hypothetical protein [Bacteroidaceae bacterium]
MQTIKYSIAIRSTKPGTKKAEVTETKAYPVFQQTGSINIEQLARHMVEHGTTFGRQRQSPGFVMRGTLDAIDNSEAAELGAYVMNDDAKWHPVLSDTEAHKAVTIPAFRCYLLQSRLGGRSAIGMKLEGADDIEQLRTIDADGTERVYDLSGRRVDENAKGVVIKNGKKIINT